MTFMTIPSTISGGPSIFQVRIGSGEVLSAGDEADVLLAFYQHSYEDHIILSRRAASSFTIPTMSARTREKRYHHLGMPITGLTVEALGGTAKDKGKNIFALGLIAAISISTPEAEEPDPRTVRGQRREHRQYCADGLPGRLRLSDGQVAGKRYKFEAQPKTARRAQVTMDGNQALAYGLIAAGVRFGPVTRSRHGRHHGILRRELPKYGGTFVQAEDEIAAVSLALGSSYAGHLAVTGSAARAFP